MKDSFHWIINDGLGLKNTCTDWKFRDKKVDANALVIPGEK